MVDRITIRNLLDFDWSTGRDLIPLWG